jgi:Cysteine-rich secretory protein family
MKSFFLFSALLLLASVPCLGATMSAAEKQVFEELNQQRAKNGQAALEWNDQAANAARVHAQTMLEHGKIEHQFPGEAAFDERIGATGVRFTVAAENVAHVEFIEDVMPALMTSPGHRANMLNPKYNAVGIGVVQRERQIYVTQDFIFSIPAYSEDQFAVAFTETLYAARKAKGVGTFKVSQDESLRQQACTTDGSAAKLLGIMSGAREIVVFTSSDPRSLSEQIRGFVLNPAYHRSSFGVCFRPDEDHGNANFWVVATFGN